MVLPSVRNEPRNLSEVLSFLPGRPRKDEALGGGAAMQPHCAECERRQDGTPIGSPQLPFSNKRILVMPTPLLGHVRVKL